MSGWDVVLILSFLSAKGCKRTTKDNWKGDLSHDLYITMPTLLKMQQHPFLNSRYTWTRVDFSGNKKYQ